MSKGKSDKVRYKPYDQEQQFLLPPSLEELVPAGHLARLVSEVIDELNVEPMLRQKIRGRGASRYHPEMFVKVFTYGYMNITCSCRLLAKALRENVVYMQMSGNQKPSFKTVNEFRRVVLKDEMEEIFVAAVKTRTRQIPCLKVARDFDSIDAKKQGFRQMQFRSTGSESDTFQHVTDLFTTAQNQCRGIFPANTAFKLSRTNLKICVSYLQDIKLFNSNLEVVDDAFEYLVNKEQKGDKGQYFTPHYVIDMCVKMLNPGEKETMIDTAAGSCGFPMHTTMYVWSKINPRKPNLFTNT